jgi:hypothetical protein
MWEWTVLRAEAYVTPVADDVRGGRACGDRVVGERPEDYDREWRRTTRRYRALTVGLLHASTHTRLRAGIVPAAQTVPCVFGKLVNVLAR